MTGWADRFASFEGVAYLDVASQGPLPLAAARAGREALGLAERPDRHLHASLADADRLISALAPGT